MKDEAGEEGGGGGIKSLIKRGGASWHFSGPGGGKGRCKKKLSCHNFFLPTLATKNERSLEHISILVYKSIVLS